MRLLHASRARSILFSRNVQQFSHNVKKVRDFREDYLYTVISTLT
jgi:hypothetical protein